MNPILIGQAEEIDLVQPQVREMLAAPGFYIGGDSNNPEMNVPLVSNKGRVFSMKIDTELDPERFLPTLTLKGPYRVDPDADDLAREAGPELLAALQGIMKWWMETPAFADGEDDMPADLFDGARFAIAKATGGKA